MASMQPDRRNHSPTAQTGTPTIGKAGMAGMPEEEIDWLERARSAYYSSTSYVDSNYRKAWEDAIRAFNNQHPTDSKYNQPAYEKRSRVYRPKTRSIIRKNEAAAAAAFFSNVDVVSISARDQTSKAEAASAEIMKEILQYRLTKSIPWYQVVLGGLQDAQTTGVACAHAYWDYKEAPAEEVVAVVTVAALPLEAAMTEGKPEGETEGEYPAQTTVPEGAMVATEQGGLEAGAPAPLTASAPEMQQPVALIDKPVIDLIPVENMRIDPGANWMDPINTSPYVIHLMPMYVLDVKEKMKAGVWLQLSDAVIGQATEAKADTTRIARNKDRDDPYSADSKSVDDYEIVWVQRHIHRRDGEDYEFYVMGDVALLTDPVPLKDTVFHGKRPYVMGCCVLETHKVFPTSIPQLSKGLQDETNEIANQRLDNVKFVLNKKWFVKRGKEADIAGLIRNVPGGVVMLDDPQADVREVTWPDVTASAFQEQQGINMEMDELLGNFNPAALMTQGAANAPARNMAMLGQSNGTLVEYLIRTFTETFVQPLLKQLVQLEQAYETDQVIMKIAAKRAKVFQKYGIDEQTDALLDNELTLTVNVGMGATDPMQKLNKFLSAMGTYTAMLQKPVPGIDMAEVGKEIFGHLGYADGSRFFTVENPQLLQAQQQLQQATALIQQLQAQVKDKQTAHQVKVVTAQAKNQTDLATAQAKNQTDITKTNIVQANENKRALATHWRALMEPHNTPAPSSATGLRVAK